MVLKAASRQNCTFVAFEGVPKRALLIYDGLKRIQDVLSALFRASRKGETQTIYGQEDASFCLRLPFAGGVWKHRIRAMSALQWPMCPKCPFSVPPQTQ